MVEVVAIITLITVAITGLAQIVQLILDYKVAERQGHGSLYKVYESECMTGSISCCDVKDTD